MKTELLTERGAMRQFNTDDLTSRDAYQLLTSTIIPRPIAFISTIGENGVANCAPFSFFTALNAKPMMLCFSIISPQGKKKDTLANIEWAKDFVVNIVSETIADAMNIAALPFPKEKSEFNATGLHPIASVSVKSPRIEESPIQMECKMLNIMPLTQEVFLVIGKTLHVHVKESLYKDDKIDQDAIRAIGALGANRYACVENSFELQRPTISL
jgi:flavin reductase (DIM6/NTAB) family NADH-FMN oxidoreductase RutF